MDTTERLIAQLRAGIAAHLPALAASRAVLAVSGGADSTAMAALLCEAGTLDRTRVTLAHFDHRLRGGDAADADRAVVEALADRYGVRLACGMWDAPEPREAAARVARYRFLHDVAARNGADAVVAGHTADDQAETVLMHALRGAGLHGLAGMAWDAPWPAGGCGLRVWRPLLSFARADTRDACDALGLAYHDDASNRDRRYMRNRLRLDTLPQLDAAQPGVRARLLALASACRAALDAIAPFAATALEAPLHPPRDCVALSRAVLRALPAELRAHAVRLALTRLLGDARDFERRHYALAADALDARTGGELMLPRGVVLTVDPAQLLLSAGPLQLPRIARDDAWALPFAGSVGAWELDVRGGLAGAVVRGRREGDRIRPRGMGGTKKLQDDYVDRNIPRRLRAAAPVIAVGGDVLWTPWAAAEGAGALAIRATCTAA